MRRGNRFHEEGNAELRVEYMFTDDYDRGAVGDAHVTVLGPDLKELAVVDVPTTTGVLQLCFAHISLRRRRAAGCRAVRRGRVAPSEDVGKA